NWGCIPTKAIIKNAEVYDLVKNHSSDFGISVDNLSFDFNKVVKRSRDVSQKVSKGVEFLMKKNKIDHIKGFGKIKSPNELDVIDDAGKTTQSILFDNLIIATGAKPKSIPSIPIDRERIITSTEAMILKEVPKE
ncbi:MAG: FAD-dependent oxidoreductase, partial [Ignavibacteriae bacterium]|nr:FAD-dependent oxidoreductase [Ignavibacteriota bacterium]